MGDEREETVRERQSLCRGANRRGGTAPVWGPVGEAEWGWGVGVGGAAAEDEGLNSDKPKHAPINRTNPELVGINRKNCVFLFRCLCVHVCALCSWGGKLWGGQQEEEESQIKMLDFKKDSRCNQCATARGKRKQQPTCD